MLKHLFRCGRNRVHKLKKKLNIYSTRKKAYKVTTNSKHNNSVAPNLLGDKYKASKPNQVWVSDITYIPTGEGWLYCCIVKDLFTKKIVGYSTSSRIDAKLCLDALNMAIYRQKPSKQQELILHSDRGVQYTSSLFKNALLNLGIKQSMGRKGNPYDNAVAENFFSCLKCECIYLQYFFTRNSAELAIFNYIEIFYNRVRPHSGIGWISPNDFESIISSQNHSIKNFGGIESNVA